MSSTPGRGRWRGGHDVWVPVTDLSSYPLRASRRRAPMADMRPVRLAVDKVSWPGTVLLPAEILGVVVYPVVEFSDVQARLSSFAGPQRCPTTLEMWETMPELGYPSPLSIVGFVGAATTWDAAVAAATRTRGLGAGMIISRRRPDDIELLDADASGLWVVGGDPLKPWVVGRPGPVASATRTLTTRVMEERLFAHALRAGMVPSS